MIDVSRLMYRIPGLDNLVCRRLNSWFYDMVDRFQEIICWKKSMAKAIYIYGGKDLSRDASRLQYNEWRILSKTAKIWGFVRAMVPQLGSSHPLLLRFGDHV